MTGPVGPLLKPCTSPAGIEPNEPQVVVLLADGLAVSDHGPHHRRVTFDSNDLRGQSEDFIWPVPVVIPHLPDGMNPHDGFFIWRVRVSGVSREQSGETIRTRRSPSQLVAGNPSVDR